MKFSKLDQAGISLVELILTMSIISIMSIVVMNFMVSWIQQYAITESRSELLADAQDAVDQMGDSIRLSSVPDLNNRWPDENAPNASDDFSWTSNSNTLILASAVEDTSGNIIFSDPSNYTSQKNNIIYYVNGGTLYRRVIAAPDAGNKLATSCPTALATAACPPDRKLAENVANFTVTYYNGDNLTVTPTEARSIELSLTLQKNQFSQLIQSVYKTRMVFRND